jgi:hypothetical protein
VTARSRGQGPGAASSASTPAGSGRGGLGGGPGLERVAAAPSGHLFPGREEGATRERLVGDIAARLGGGGAGPLGLSPRACACVWSCVCVCACGRGGRGGAGWPLGGAPLPKGSSLRSLGLGEPGWGSECAATLEGTRGRIQVCVGVSPVWTRARACAGCRCLRVCAGIALTGAARGCIRGSRNIYVHVLV